MPIVAAVLWKKGKTLDKAKIWTRFQVPSGPRRVYLDITGGTLITAVWTENITVEVVARNI